MPPAGAAAEPAGNEREYGLYAVAAGLLVLVGFDGAALAVLSHNINGAVAVIGAISAPVVAMVSAYFGIKASGRSGSASAAAAEGPARKPIMPGSSPRPRSPACSVTWRPIGPFLSCGSSAFRSWMTTRRRRPRLDE